MKNIHFTFVYFTTLRIIGVERLNKQVYCPLGYTQLAKALLQFKNKLKQYQTLWALAPRKIFRTLIKFKLGNSYQGKYLSIIKLIKLV